MARGLRKKLQDPKVGGIVVAALIVIALIVVFSGGGGGNRIQGSPTSYWYYNVETNELYEGPVGVNPPIDDGKGARAYVFSCGACTESEQFIAYIEKYSDEYKKIMEGVGQTDRLASEAAARTGHLIRSADGGEWIAFNSPEGQDLMKKGMKSCPGGKKMTTCYP